MGQPKNSLELRAALERNAGSVAATAREFGVTRKTIYRLMYKYQIVRMTLFLREPNAK